MGTEVGELIEQERTKNGIFKNLEDFLTRCQSVVNKKTVESLAKAGAFNGFMDRKTILHNVARIIDRTKMSSSESANNSLFAMSAVKPALQLDKTEESTKMERLLTEYDVFKTFVS